MKGAFLGIDNGTQGLSVLLTREDNLEVIASGEATYGYVPDLSSGCYEQYATDWEVALKLAVDQISPYLEDYRVLAIGLSGQMHGQVMVDDQSHVVGTVRLWCDARNQQEADDLAKLFGIRIPKRCTVARWLWTVRNQPELAKQCDFMTTPGGWLAYRMTQKRTLGIGDASGMFPMDSSTNNYRTDLLQKFDAYINDDSIPKLKHILPKAIECGKDAGVLTEEAAHWLGLPAGIPVAAAEGDQPAALAGSLIGRSGMVSCSFGTSVCCNLVGSPSDPLINSSMIDHFCAPNGSPIYMVWLRNGTTFFNTMIESYGGNFEELMPEVIAASPDCDGLLALPFMDDEPGLAVHQGGTSMVVGFNPKNSTAGNVCKAALLSTMFNLRKGLEVLQSKGVATTELILTGGLTKTPECGQILANVFGLRVRLLAKADEGCSWGGAVLAKYRYSKGDGKCNDQDWATFLESLPTPPAPHIFSPQPETASIYNDMYYRHKQLLALQPQLERVASVAST